MTTSWYASLITAVLAVSPVDVTATQSVSGCIDGTVADQSGAVLVGAIVTLRLTGLGFERTVVTDERGVFLAPGLPVGFYEVRATMAGFEPRELAGVRLTVGGTVTVRLEMRIVGVKEGVDVAGGAAGVDVRRSHVAATVGESVVKSLPVNGRNFIDFVLLTPGVTRDVRTGDLSFAGQRGTLNSLIVDGADNNNTFSGQALGRVGSGRAPYQFSLETVQEFQVNANAFSAEYGRAGGAVINVVTRSGSNEFQGAVFEFYRDKALNATDVIARLNGQPKRPYHFHQFGGSLGGPLRRQRDFFFTAYDGQRNREENTVIFDRPGWPDDAATRAAIEELRGLAGSWDRTLDQDIFMARTDHAMGGSARTSMRYNHQNFTGAGYETGGPAQAYEHTGTHLVKTRTLSATWSSVLGRRFFNEVRLQIARDQLRGTANSEAPEAIILQTGTPALFIGRNNFSPRDTTIDRVQAANSLAWTISTHTLKAGADVQLDNIRNYFPGFFSGSYTFTSLAAFHAGNAASYQQNFPGPSTNGPWSRPDSDDFSFYIQDEWRAARGVTLNAGVRYDLLSTAASRVRNPDPQLAAADIDTSRLETDTNNWGPRLGIAWNPGASPFVVRGGGGLFYGRTPAQMITTTHGSNGISVQSLRFTGDEVPRYPHRFTAIPPAQTRPMPSIFYVDRNFANPRLTHANLAMEGQLGRYTSLAVTYLFVQGRDLPRAVDRNIGTETERRYSIADTTASFSYPRFEQDRPFSNFQRVIALESSAESRYNGVTIALSRRFDGNLQLSTAYTLGKVIDTVPDATAVLPGAADDVKYASHPRDYDVDRAVGVNDQRHRVVVAGMYSSTRHASGLGGLAGVLARGWTFSAILTAQSGAPFSARVGAADLNNDGNTRNDLAPGTRRHEFRLPAIVTLDPRIVREIPIAGRARAHLTLEAFNLFNRDNINGVEPNLYAVNGAVLSRNPRFGRPVSSAGERILQFAARIEF